MPFIFIVKDYINLEEVAAVEFDDAQRIIAVQFKDLPFNDRKEYQCREEEYATEKKRIFDKLGKFLV